MSDGLAHREPTHWSHWAASKRLTACGQEWTPDKDNDGPKCDVCYPNEAHPLAAIWRHCRRLDDRYNAEVARGAI